MRDLAGLILGVNGLWSTIGGALIVWIVSAALRGGGKRSRGPGRHRRASDRREQPVPRW
jgi:hypothetical protein